MMKSGHIIYQKPLTAYITLHSIKRAPECGKYSIRTYIHTYIHTYIQIDIDTGIYVVYTPHSGALLYLYIPKEHPTVVYIPDR